MGPTTPTAPMSGTPGDADARRRAMVERQIVARGVRDPRVLDAMRSVPREEFVPQHLAGLAFDDHPLPISCGQTISQPFVVAFMAEALAIRPSDRVLEVGAGTGYAAAVLSRLACDVIAVERHAELARTAREACHRLGFANVRIVDGDGSLGWPAGAPYDAIAVACAAPSVPPALVAHLAPGGRMVVPVGTHADDQHLIRVRRHIDGRVTEESLGDVRFVPLVSEEESGSH